MFHCVGLERCLGLQSLMMASKSVPPDGGWGWMCVVGKFLCYVCTGGSSTAFGILYIALIESYNTTREKVAWVGSLSLGITHLAGPLASALISRFGIQKTTAAGAILAFTGCFISWFADGIPYLYISYGGMFGIGSSLVFIPSMLIVVQYFDKRLGLANCIGSVGEGLGTLVLPPFYTYLLEEYGWRGTMLILSGIFLNMMLCAVIWIPPPFLKVSTKNDTANSFQPAPCTGISHILRNPSLVIYMTASAFSFLGYIVPVVHLPDMAIQTGIDKNQAVYLISIMGVSNIAGRIVFGWISDFSCVNVLLLQSVSVIICGVITAVCPHLAEFYTLAAYSTVFGLFVGSYTSLTPVGLLVLVGLSDTGHALGVQMFLAGIIITLASPLAGWLFDTTKTYNASFYVAGGAFVLVGILIFTAMVLNRRKMLVFESHVQEDRNPNMMS